MRVLFDTNVLVSALAFGGLPRLLLLHALDGEYELVTSAELLDELERTLVAKIGMAPASARLARRELEAHVSLRRPSTIGRVLRDPTDDAVLAAAVGGRVHYLVSGDRDVLVQRSFGRIRNRNAARVRRAHRAPMNLAR